MKIRSSSGCEGYHTITTDGELFYTDRDKKVIKRVTKDNEIIEFINTGDWEALSINSSKINVDILVGFEKGSKRESRQIQQDRRGNTEHTERQEKTKTLIYHTISQIT